MDLTGILELGASLIRQNSDQSTTGIATDQLVSALQSALGGRDGGFDPGSLVGRLQESGLGNLAASWLGTGSNASISPDQVASFLGSGKIEEFAARLGISTESAKTAIADALPEMIDKASPGGALLENLTGNLGGLGDIMKKLF
jgi:uncharacterized protein YidB (DUF937 family)